MIEQDTIKLLRECDAGIKMGVSSIDEVLDHVKDGKFRQLLYDCKSKHETLDSELQQLLDQYHDEGKEPNALIQGMSWMKSNVMMSMTPNDATIADLMTDGCNMGVKSLHRYLNQYRAADENAKNMARRLSRLEEQLAVDMRGYL